MSAAFDLQGRVAVVTGGARGIGLAVAEELIARGAQVVIADAGASISGDAADPSVARTAAERLGACAVPFVDDIAVPGAAQSVVNLAVERFGALDIVVNNAAILRDAFIFKATRTDWERVIAVNLVGTAAVIRAAIPALRPGRGRIVTVASTLGFRALGDATAYCASKFGVVGFTRALASELAGEIGVTLLVPGGMRTAFFDGRDEQYRPGDDAQLNDPHDVAAAVLFALSQPSGCELRELVMAPATDGSWPP